MNNTKINNLDAKSVVGFGDVLSRFDQSSLSTCFKLVIFEVFFHFLPLDIV